MDHFGFVDPRFRIMVVFQVVNADNAASIAIIQEIYKPLKNVTV
jgi:hypothetical protein